MAMVHNIDIKKILLSWTMDSLEVKDSSCYSTPDLKKSGSYQLVVAPSILKLFDKKTKLPNTLGLGPKQSKHKNDAH